MRKYNKRILKKITDLIRSDYYTVAEICANVGISERSFYYWQNSIAEFADAIKGAKEHQTEKMVVQATRSLFKLIQGYYAESYKTIYENSGKLDLNGKPIGKPKEWTVFKKYYHPSFPAILFVLCNLDKEHWKNPFRIEITGKEGKDIYKEAKDFWSKLSDTDLDKKLKEIDQKLIGQSSVSAAK